MRDNDVLTIASWVCCPLCDEKTCVGRENCNEIKNFIENKEGASDGKVY